MAQRNELSCSKLFRLVLDRILIDIDVFVHELGFNVGDIIGIGFLHAFFLYDLHSFLYELSGINSHKLWKALVLDLV